MYRLIRCAYQMIHLLPPNLTQRTLNLPPQRFRPSVPLQWAIPDLVPIQNPWNLEHQAILIQSLLPPLQHILPHLFQKIQL